MLRNCINIFQMIVKPCTGTFLSEKSGYVEVFTAPLQILCSIDELGDIAFSYIAGQVDGKLG